LLVPLASAFGVGGVEADGTGGLAGGMLILRTLSRMICRIVFRKALRNSAVLQSIIIFVIIIGKLEII
jgi:hypothetical protein